MVLSRLAIAAACVSFALAPIAHAQNIQEQAEAKVKAMTAELQAHSATARTEGAEAAKAMQANDKPTACTHYKTSRAETQKIIDLLPQQREQILLASTDTVSAIGRANKVDEMMGTWLGLASQLDERIKMACPS